MPESAAPAVSRVQRSWSAAIFSSGWLWGLVAVFAFYGVLPSIPDPQGQLQRYFAAHWIEYTTTGLFFVGMATLGLRALQVPSERRALSSGLLDELPPPAEGSVIATADAILAHLKLVARGQSSSLLVRRIVDVCNYVRGRRSTDGLEAQLSYLADSAAARLNGSYGSIRTITWAVPILGFLGTVIGITLSIANITPDQLESSLNEVTGGLAVAFDTTALSLALSMVLVFTTYVVERQEQQVLDAVEDFSMQQLVPLFPTETDQKSQAPLLAAEQAAANVLLQKTESLVSWQMEAWQAGLDALRERWAGTLERQQEALDRALQSGLTDALTDHAQQLAAARGDFVAAFSLAAQAVREQMAVTQEVLQAQHVTQQLELQQTWQSIRHDLQTSTDRQTEQWEELRRESAEQMAAWQQELGRVSLTLSAQLAEFQSQAGQLLKLTEHQEHLVQLEGRLAQELQTGRVVETLDETLLNLNAAVHLLSSRTMGRAA